MRCDKNCVIELFPSPALSNNNIISTPPTPTSTTSFRSLNDTSIVTNDTNTNTPNTLPKCPKCNGLARPHTLFFDESYNEEYYFVNTIKESVENSMDCIVVIGTTLETNLSSTIVSHAIHAEKLIIEINPEPVIKCGIVR